jgi:hypothetical protein
MRIRFLAATIAFTVSTAAAWALTAAPGYGSLSATTGDATSVTSTAATLNGVALTLNSTSAWRFQYGTTAAYGHWSVAARVGLGLTAVSATISNLRPSTTYHFRLVVIQGDPDIPSDWSTGDDGTFTTAPSPTPASADGTASLRSTHLRVRGWIVLIPFRCHGTARTVCKGRVAWEMRAARGRLVKCGTGTLTAASGHDGNVRSGVSLGCMRLLRVAPRHRRTAALFAGLPGAGQLLGAIVTVVD